MLGGKAVCFEAPRWYARSGSDAGVADAKAVMKIHGGSRLRKDAGEARLATEAARGRLGPQSVYNPPSSIVLPPRPTAGRAIGVPWGGPGTVRLLAGRDGIVPTIWAPPGVGMRGYQ
jgi:hypothetical protein